MNTSLARAHLSVDARLALLESSAEDSRRELHDIKNGVSSIATEIAEGRRDSRRIQLLLTLVMLGGFGFGTYQVTRDRPQTVPPSPSHIAVQVEAP